MTHCKAYWKWMKRVINEVHACPVNPSDKNQHETVCEKCEFGDAQQSGYSTQAKRILNHILYMDTFFPDWLTVEWDANPQPIGCTPEGAMRPLWEEKRSEIVQNALFALVKWYKLHKQTPNASVVNRIMQEARDKFIPLPEPPQGEYQVIVIDPPWPRLRAYNPGYARGPPSYPTMSLDAIKELKIPSGDDCVLWLWSPSHYLHDAFHLLEGWGFEYKATLVWDKQAIGLGYWFRHRAEYCLLGIKGHPQWNNSHHSDILEAARREHSRKPDAFYELVDELCSGRKLDMFSREPREDWKQWGAEVEMFARA